MDDDFQAEELDAVGSLLAAAAPGEPTDTQLERAHERVGRARFRSRRRVTARVASVLVALTAVAVVIAVSLQGPDTSEPAFAYGSAASVLLPQDGVLHVVTVMKNELPVEGYAGELTPEGQVPDVVSEQWIDVANGRFRTEIRMGGPDEPVQSASIRVGDRQRTLHDFSAPEGPTDRLLEEGPASDDDDPLSLVFVLERLAQGIRTQDCEIVEDVSESGEAVWRVSWVYEGPDYILRTQVVLGQADYRPLSFHHALDANEEGWAPAAQFDVTTWETLAYDEVPADTFDLDSLDDPTANKSIDYAADDPRLKAFSEFPAWWLGAESGAGELAGAHLMDWDYLGYPDAVTVLTFTYGDSRLRGPHALSSPTAGVAVTTYAPGDTSEVETTWLAQQGSVDNRVSSGEIAGIEYRVNTLLGFYSWALMRIDGQLVEVIGPDEAAVLAAIAELEPL